MVARRKKFHPRRSDEKTPGHDPCYKAGIVIRSLEAASAVIVLTTKIIEMIDVVVTIFGG